MEMNLGGIVHRIQTMGCIMLLLSVAIALYGFKGKDGNKEMRFKTAELKKKSRWIGVVGVAFWSAYILWYLFVLASPKIAVFEGTFVHRRNRGGAPMTHAYYFDAGAEPNRGFYLDLFTKKEIMPDGLEADSCYRVFYEERTKIITAVELLDKAVSLEYDNSTAMNQLITKCYPEQEIDELIIRVDAQDIDGREFRDRYDLECIRKVSEGYYTILKTDNGRYAFVLMDTELNPIERGVFVVDRFKTKEEFEKYVSVQRTWGEMKAFDSSMLTPFYGRFASMHHVVEGVFVVHYQTRIEPLDESKIVHIEFFDNDVSYILPIDKESKN